MQLGFDDLILVSPIIQIFGWKLFLFNAAKRMPEFYIKTTVKENYFKW